MKIEIFLGKGTFVKIFHGMQIFFGNEMFAPGPASALYAHALRLIGAVAPDPTYDVPQTPIVVMFFLPSAIAALRLHGSQFPDSHVVTPLIPCPQP